MKNNEKLQAFVELYNLINFYYENRDLPVNEDFNFNKEVEKHCEILGLNSKEFIKEFKLEMNFNTR